MGSAQSWLENDPRFSRILVRWYNKPVPETVNVHLVQSEHNFWSLAIDFESAPVLDIKTFSGLLCIPQLLADRRIYPQVLDWPSEKTRTAFATETATCILVGKSPTSIACKQLKQTLPDFNLDRVTCDLLVSGIRMLIQEKFAALCKLVHPNTVSPEASLLFQYEDAVHEVTWPAADFSHGDYWDDQLNEKSLVLAILECLGVLHTDIALPANTNIDLVMATLITKAEICTKK